MWCVHIINVNTFILNASYTCMSNSKIIGIRNLDSIQRATHGYVLYTVYKLYSTEKIIIFQKKF